MQQKIVTLSEIEAVVSHLHTQGKKIVLAGGGFEILHRGHITFLTEAKKQGDILIVMLESDADLRSRKGERRPVNTARTRATILSALPAVDYVLLLSRILTDQEYDTVVLAIKPAIIATTKGDPGRRHKERQAARIHASVVDVTNRLPPYASSFLAEKITDL